MSTWNPKLSIEASTNSSSVEFFFKTVYSTLVYCNYSYVVVHTVTIIFVPTYPTWILLGLFVMPEEEIG